MFSDRTEALPDRRRCDATHGAPIESSPWCSSCQRSGPCSWLRPIWRLQRDVVCARAAPL